MNILCFLPIRAELCPRQYSYRLNNIAHTLHTTLVKNKISSASLSALLQSKKGAVKNAPKEKGAVKNQNDK